MTDSEFLRLKEGAVVREGNEFYTLISLNPDNTDVLIRHRDGMCGKVLDERLISMVLVTN